MIKKLLFALSFISFSAFAQLQSEGFEGTWTAGSGPVGWATLNVSGPDNIWRATETNNADEPAYEGAHAAIIEGEDVAAGSFAEDWLITPAFTVPGDGGQLHFYSQLRFDGNDATYKVVIGTDLSNTATFTELATWNSASLNPAFGSYLEKTVALPVGNAGQTRYIAFVSQGDDAHNWLIDNVGISQSCPPPANLIVTNITETSATLSWTETGFATAWEVVIVPQGTVPGAGPGTVTYTNPFVFTGLTPNVCYNFYVKSVCDATTTSAYSGPMGFCVGQGFTAINGAIHFDTNGDGVCSAQEAAVPNMEVQVAVNGVAASSVYTGADGHYTYYFQPGADYTVTFTPVAPAGFSAPGAITTSYTYTPQSGETVVAGPDFCLAQSQTPVNNLSVLVTPTTQIVPGFAATFLLTVQNNGSTNVASAPATFSFDTTRFTLVSIDGVPAISGSPLNFTFTDLDPFETNSHTIVLLATVPPINNGGDYTAFTAQLDYTDDATADNSHELWQMIVNSFDPNDITVHEGAEITLTEAAGYLTYTIRFENTGNGAANKVVVQQELDAKLDWETFHPVTASHNFTAERNDNGITINFSNINLPFSTPDDQVTGHGFVTYRIKPKANVAIGDIMLGTAGIYFDFNEPVITNTCSTEIVEVTAGADSFTSQNIKLYPNPATDRINISLTDGALQSVTVYDLNGRLCLTSGNAAVIDTHQLTSGLYMVKVVTDKGTGNYKLIKR